MTDEEKAAIFIKRYWGTYTEAFRDETIPRLVKLIQDEREENAKICDEMIAPVTENHQCVAPTINNCSWCGALEIAAKKIRARSS